MIGKLLLKCVEGTDTIYLFTPSKKNNIFIYLRTISLSNKIMIFINYKY